MQFVAKIDVGCVRVWIYSSCVVERQPGGQDLHFGEWGEGTAGGVREGAGEVPEKPGAAAPDQTPAGLCGERLCSEPEDTEGHPEPGQPIPSFYLISCHSLHMYAHEDTSSLCWGLCY